MNSERGDTMKTRYKYIRDIHYKIIGVYLSGFVFQTNQNYCGLLVDGKQILNDSDFNVLCSDQIARKRLVLVATAYVNTLNQ